MLIVGLTGSIGMGKSTTAAMFRARGVPVHDADRAVHHLYEGDAVGPVGAAFGGVVKAGAIDRGALGALLAKEPDRLQALEAIVHPLVRRMELAACESAVAAGHKRMVLDIPLLFESGAETRCDVVLVVSAPWQVQKERVMARPGMTEDKFQALLDRQWSDCRKRQAAHYLVDTGNGFESARRQVDDFLKMCCMMGH